VARSGKPLDGIYSTFDRRLCRSVVRLLSHTSITPNAVTLAGLAVAILSCLEFARGFYAAHVCGALLFFLSGLCDEMDGMLARIKFRESTFGTWFEGFVDNATYLLVFVGMTIGLYRQRGHAELVWGMALIAGSVLSVVLINLQRKRSTDAARPNEYRGNLYATLDSDSSNFVSFAARHLNVFLKKAVAIHYLLLFTLFGGLTLFLRLAAIGSNLTWILTIYFNRRFFRPSSAAVNAEMPTAA
jgi:phosphatidylglycerophosphate synthase